MRKLEKISKKLVDSNEKLSQGGRAQSWWAGSNIKRNAYSEVDEYSGKLDQFEIIKKYSLKGFEYGNWVNNNDRYDRLDATAQSCKNLSRLLGTQNIGCDGNIGIAFGARGKSKAAAHFEPHTFMINLTKLNGFGALAHEYGHALDYFFGMYVDQDREYTSLVGGRSTQQYLEPSGGTLRRMAMELVNSIIKDKNEKSETYKNWQNTLPSEYWFRRNEIFARTFEQWVRHKLNEKKIRNTFLAERKYEDAAYLKKADFERILPLMDRLLKEMAAFMNNKKKVVKYTKKPTKTAARR